MNKKIFELSYLLRMQKKSRDTKIIIAIIFSFIFLFFVLNFLIYPIMPKSASMAPSYPENSYLFVTPIVNTVQRGDVVIVNSYNSSDFSFVKKFLNTFVGFFTARKVSLLSNKDYPQTNPKIRRVVALPGDTIYMQDNKVFVKPKDKKHYLTEFELTKYQYDIVYSKPIENWDNSIGITSNFSEITMQEDQYFVLSDDRAAFEDSRIWGSITKEKIGGKVFACVFPFKNAQFLF